MRLNHHRSKKRDLGLEILRKVGCIEGAAGQGGQRAHESDQEMTYECLVILNSFLIDFPDAIDVFNCLASQIKESVQTILEKCDFKV